MKLLKSILAAILFLTISKVYAQFNYQRDWATYSGGRGSRGTFCAIDSQKNVIRVGAVLPTTEPLTYYNQFATTGSYQQAIAGGDSDLYLTKFSRDGNLIWATYFGGSDFENAIALILDSDDNIYFGGQTLSNSGIATAGTYIPNFSPSINSKCYMVKFDANGNRLWGTYLPGSMNAIALGSNNTIYAAGSTRTTIVGLTNLGVFQENFQIPSGFDLSDTSHFNGHIIQLDTDTGNKINGSYCGSFFNVTNLTTDSTGNLILGGNTSNWCIGTALSTQGAYQEMQVNCNVYGSNVTGKSDCVLAKFTPNLQTRIWSTYYGGIGSEGIRSLTTNGENIYISGGNSNNSILPTAGTFQQTPSATLISKFNGAGNRLWATGFGDNDTFVGHLSVINNKLFFSGSVLATTTFPIATSGVYQETIAGLSYIDENGNAQTCRKGLFGQFNATTGARDWSSYYSGELYDACTIIIRDENTFYLSGFATSTTGIATMDSWQPNISLGSNPPASIFERGNSFLAKFSIPALTTNSFSKTSLQLSPNPNNGIFSLQGDFSESNKNLQLIVCDNLGRNIANSKVSVFQNQVNQEFNFSNELTSGVYFAKLVSDNEILQVFKVLVQ